ncbi:helix-turn-helix domain-containing protein [Bacteroides gallinarum]|uniref:helix-turn-helix domain-containing protein n=1 Tax=Bacteroides gallinarum TaxID=376806 RepID=UPI0003AA18C5|nr:helix-turn-helix domain-containing protein [Bacteroides gallinarum]
MTREKTDYNTLPEQIDYLIQEIEEIKSMLSSKMDKPENIPKYLDIDQALAYMRNLGFPISKSKLYKLTSGCHIPHSKSNSRVYFQPQELENWVSSQINKLHNKETLYTLNTKIYGTK